MAHARCHQPCALQEAGVVEVSYKKWGCVGSVVVRPAEEVDWREAVGCS